jgi:hypothetical protein
VLIWGRTITLSHYFQLGLLDTLGGLKLIHIDLEYLALISSTISGLQGNTSCDLVLCDVSILLKQFRLGN